MFGRRKFLAAAACGTTVAIGGRLTFAQDDEPKQLDAELVSQFVGKSHFDFETVKKLADQAMVVNPSVEVYLVDTDGKIVGHALPADSVPVTHVDLEPVRRLLAGDVEMPWRGTDPRNPGGRKVFSAAEVRSEGRLQGYLYVVLGGARYDELASSIRDSYVLTTSATAIAAILVAAALAGLLVFGLLTRRLTRLSADVQRFADTDFRDAALIGASTHAGDEIGRLRNAVAGMARKIEDQLATLTETDRLRRDLVSNISHDLRTPVASLQGYVDTLIIRDDKLDDEERRRYLATVRKHTRRLSQLIEDLFELSKLETDSFAPSFEPFPLAELLQDLSQEFALDAEKRGITIEVNAASKSATVVADIGLMQRVLENLLRNALAYTPAGGRISIDVAEKPDGVAVAVSDTGCGIADTELPRIFDRFYRAQNGAASQVGSTGLGLAIVKRILDLHGSRITVTSKPNEGTRFEFDLPARRAA